ncbi:MAG: hypothetical protein EBZ76_07815 [Synechococcaceae bacterium WB9_2_170]|nr:hypothetical protein [Synechococcaceae bacterium WB9_2_170]
MLRLSDQRYRTCLECLGQGQRPALSAAITTAVLFNSEKATVERARIERAQAGRSAIQGFPA